MRGIGHNRTKVAVSYAQRFKTKKENVMNSSGVTSALGSQMQHLTDKSPEFCDGLYFNKELDCTDKVKNPRSSFIFKNNELPSTLISHLKVPKILTSVNATYTEVLGKSFTYEPFQRVK